MTRRTFLKMAGVLSTAGVAVKAQAAFAARKIRARVTPGALHRRAYVMVPLIAATNGGGGGIDTYSNTYSNTYGA